MSVLEALRKRLGSLRSTREDLAADDETRSADRRGTVHIGDLEPRHRARVSGVLRAVTYRPASDKLVLVGQLFDGTGSIDLVWIGRRQIAGVRPGTHLVAEGMVAAGRSRLTMYNPSYELLEPGA